MREILSWAYDKGYELGRKHGLVGGAKELLKGRLFADDADMPLAVVMAFGAAILGLYITTIVMGSVSDAIVGGVTDYYGNGTAMSFAYNPESGMTGMMNTRWNKTLVNLDTSSSGSVSLAAVIPIAIIGIGILGLLMASFSR